MSPDEDSDEVLDLPPSRWLLLVRSLPVMGLAIYLGIVGLMFGLQERLIFHPGDATVFAAVQTEAQRVGAEELSLHASDGTAIYGWRLPGGDRGAVLYFHGNGGTVMGSLLPYTIARQRGYDVYAIDYRGYPGSAGQPGQAGIALDARALWDEVVDVRGVPAARVVIHGRSLGGGVASQLAEAVHPGALVLESTFTSLTDRAAESYPWLPVRLLIRHPFNTLARASQIDAPTLLIHGDADEVVSVEHSRVLHHAFVGSRYVEVHGRGHNDGVFHDPVAAEAYRSFLP